MRKISLLPILCLLFVSCATNQGLFKTYKGMNSEEKKLTDSLLSWGLDHEALYTILDTLKPISSIKLYRLPLLDPDPLVYEKSLRELETLNTLLKKISTKELTYLLNPYRIEDGKQKNLEVYVVRNRQMANRIQEQAAFYRKLGITPSSSPATVLAITEYEGKYNRWQSYGYLFGYPAYAVDFFVEAGKEQDSTGKFVARDFFAIPVHAAPGGYFTYAMPKGQQPGMIDSTLFNKAQTTLTLYRQLRPAYEKDGRIDPVKLLANRRIKRRKALQ